MYALQTMTSTEESGKFQFPTTLLELIKLAIRTVRWTRHVARMEAMRNVVYYVLVGNPEGKT